MLDSINKRVLEQKLKHLADEIADKVDMDFAVYEAFSTVPREHFVPSALSAHAYKLDALPISANQWISSPLTVAKMTSALDVNGVDSVLEIGCGSGYQAAILSKIVRRVFTVERIEGLLKQAKKTFSELGLNNIHARFDDGQRGWKTYAPYERILFSASIKSIPQNIFDQLAEDGKLVAPIQKDDKQIITKFTKTKGQISSQVIEECLFVPVLDGTDK